MVKLRKIKNVSFMCFAFGLCIMSLHKFKNNSQLIPAIYETNISIEQNSKTHAEIEPFNVNISDGRNFQNDNDAAKRKIEIDTILNKTRAEIKDKLKNYDFKYSGVNQLEDLVMEVGGKPIRTLIISTWRSGSSFLSDLLNSMPGTFYYYEPFLHSKTGQIQSDQVNNAIDIIKKLYHCSFDPKDVEIDMFQMGWNKQILEFGERKELIFDPAFFKRFCSLFPFQIMKLLRFHLRFVEELLQVHPELDLKVVLLVRDPRAVMQSRQHVKFCRRFKDCSEPELLCKDMVSDYEAAARLLQKYPDRLMVIRFEELALNLQYNTYKLLKFLKRQEMPEIIDFLQTHTKLKVDNNFSTYRDTKEIPFKWKNILDFEYVKSIHMVCSESMKLWGYKQPQNVTHMMDKDFHPLDGYFINK